MIDARAGDATVAFGQHRTTVRVPEGLSLASGAAVRLCIRPEALSLRSPDAPADGLVVAGSVTRRAFQGDLMRYWVSVDGQEWIVDQPDPGGSGLFEGSVTVAVRPERVHLIADQPGAGP